MVKIFKLISGMDIIAEVEEGKENVWKMPFILTPQPQHNGQIAYNIMVFIPYSTEKMQQVEIENMDSKVLTHFEPDDYFVNLYRDHADKMKLQLSGVTPPDKEQKRNLVL